MILPYDYRWNGSAWEPVPAPIEDLYYDFKGWRFRAPFHCMACGVAVTARQWAFGRACGSCDCGRPVRATLNHRGWYAGPVELLDPFASGFLAASELHKPPKRPQLAASTPQRRYGIPKRRARI